MNTMTTAKLIIYAADVLGGTEEPIRQGECLPDVAVGLVNAFGAASFDEDLAEFPGYQSPMELVCAALEAWASHNDVSTYASRSACLRGGVMSGMTHTEDSIGTITKIAALIDECKAVADDQASTDQTLTNWEPTPADLEYITDELGFKPTSAQWALAGWPVFSAHSDERPTIHDYTTGAFVRYATTTEWRRYLACFAGAELQAVLDHDATGAVTGSDIATDLHGTIYLEE